MTRKSQAENKLIVPLCDKVTINPVLANMLTYMRPAGTVTEQLFKDRYILSLEGMQQDDYNNCYIRIGTAPILWSCHTDTVHKKEGRQKISVGNTYVSLSKGSKSNCLGADDTAGVWLMRKMIRAGVEGLYIFHSSEECGGLGSSYIAESKPSLISDIKYAIALDRKGTKDVITYQGTRCCSDVFAKSLAKQLNAYNPRMEYVPDSSGIFTDTANYTSLIGECTNISVGYYNQHSSDEVLDYTFLQELFHKLCMLDYRQLTDERIPGDDAYDYGSYFSYLNNTPVNASGRVSIKTGTNVCTFPGSYAYPDERREHDFTSLERLVSEHPDIAASILEAFGVDTGYFIDEMQRLGYLL